MKKFPILYHKGSKGAIYSWEVWATRGVLHTRYGQLDGEKVTSSKEAKPKNVGRSNETSINEQAELEAAALWKHKLERKYSETIPGEESTLFLPMLAKNYDAYKNKITFPVYVQRKLDGVRCLATKNADGQVVLTSRQGKEWTQVPHINEALKDILNRGGVLDGELYIHGLSLQNLNSLVKKAKPGTEKVEYHIYDVPTVGTVNRQWYNRYIDLLLVDLMVSDSSVIKVVNTIKAVDPKQVNALHDEFVGQGYEGAIIRTSEGLYKYGYRSSDLLKLKAWQTAEYEVTGFREGEGSHKGCVVWICKTEKGLTFEVNPKATIEDKKQFFTDAEQYIGRKLTIKFVDFTDSGIPKYANGLAFRLDEDMPLEEAAQD